MGMFKKGMSDKEKKELEDFEKFKAERAKKEAIVDEEMEEIESEDEDDIVESDPVPEDNNNFFDELTNLVGEWQKKGTTVFQMNCDMMYLVSKINQQVYEEDGSE